MKRWMAGAVAALAVVAGLATPGPATASTAWYQTLQVNRRGIFNEVAAISRSNIWAAGDLWGKKGNPIYQPFIWHYDDSGWAAVTIPGSPKFQSDHVSASAANDVWVFGLTPGSVAHSAAYRYDGSHWHKIPVPAETDLQGAVALGPNNVWAFGTGSIFAPGSDVSATVFHWNGTKWRGYSLAGGDLIPESISASAGNNVWIAGAVRAGKVYRTAAYRWNGTGWHNANLPRVFNDMPGVSAFSPGNVWIGWNTADTAHALHWNGQHWHTLTIPATVDANTSNVARDGQGGYWFGPNAILTGSTWTSEPIIEITGGFSDVVRIPGTQSALLPAGVDNNNTPPQLPTLYRFDLSS